MAIPGKTVQKLQQKSKPPQRPASQKPAPRRGMDTSDMHIRNEVARTKFMEGKSPAQIRAQQQFLRSKGYDVKVDGVRGKFTNSAWQSFQNAGKAKNWNRFVKNHFGPKGQAARPSGNPGTPTPVAASPTRPAPQAGKVAKGGGKPARTPSAAAKAAPASLSWGNFDPEKYARSAVEAEFGPQIAELTAAKQRIAAQGANAQTDIQGWYQDLLKQADVGAQANLSQLTNILGGHDAAVQGAVGALGGGQGAADVGVWGNIGRTELAAQGMAQGAHDNRMKTLLPLQGADSRLRVLRDFSEQGADMESKLAALRQAKGGAYSKALYEAQDLGQRNRIAQMNAEAQQALMPLEIQQAQQGITRGNQEIRQNNQQIRLNEQQAKIDYDLKRLQLESGLRELNGQGQEAAVPNFRNLDPEQLSSLRSNLLSEVVSADNPSKLAVNPMAVYNAWGNTLRGISGSKWNAAKGGDVMQWRNNLLRTFLPAWNRAHPKKQYGFRNGKLVYLASGKRR